MTDLRSLQKEIVKSFFVSFKRLSLYSLDHPLSKDVLNNLFKIFSSYLREKKQMLLAVGLNVGELYVDNENITSDALGAREIYERFKVCNLDGINFIAGLTYAELTDFVKALVSSEFKWNGSEHIQIKKIHYEQVEEGEAVAKKEEIGGNVLRSSSNDTSGALKDFLTGKGSGFVREGVSIIEELDRSCTDVVRALVESVKESGDLESVIKKFVTWVSKNVVPVVVAKKRDPSKFMQKLFDSFRNEELHALSPSADAIIEDCSKEIKLAMMEEAFSLHKDAPLKATNALAKILSDEDDPVNFLSRFQQRLKDRGVSEEDAVLVTQKIHTELVKDEEVLVSKKKLQKLTRLSQKFEDEVSKKVNKAVEGLVKDNKRLSDEKEMSEGVMRHLADGLVVVDKTGKIVMMNPAAEKLLGYDMKNAVGRSLVEGLREEHVVAVAPGALKDGSEGPITKEIEVSSKDEVTKRILRASSAVVENENGKTVGMVSVLSDITREKEIDEMKSHFVSLVTHELRTPVVAIQKSLELILNKTTGAINEDQERFLSISKFNLERLNRLINDLLDMSQLEAGKMRLKFTNFDFCIFLNEVKSSLQSWAQAKEIKINLDIGSVPVDVTADRDRLTQVLVNLLGNALKFSPDHGEIWVALRACDSIEGICPGPCIEVTVKDNGIGIEPKDFKRIFDKFEQVSLVEPKGTTGTGLGLPIAKEIIGLHNGVIRVESQKGKGSSFIFVIPRHYRREH